MSFDGSASIGSGTITSFKLGIVNPANSSIPATSPTGSIVMWSGTSLVDGWLFTDGSLKDKTAYPNLFAILGDTYGTQTSSQFYLPNLQDKFAIGKGSTYATLGATGGASTVTPSGTNSAPSFSGSAFTPSGSVSISGSTGSHTLTEAQIPSHAHYVMTDGGPITNYTSDWGTANANKAFTRTNNGNMGSSDYHIQYKDATPDRARSSFIGSGSGHSHGLSASGSFSGNSTTPTFTGSNTSVLNPYLCVNYIIKT
jgi:microcystin-dependent protein